MIKEIILKDKILYYNLQYKNVKNVNLRIKSDGSINVSANRIVPQRFIEDFLISKTDFILNALNKYEKEEKRPQIQYFAEDEIKNVILEICKNEYPYFKKMGVKYPEIKFRKMVSRWGSCHASKGILTFNTNLIYADFECIKYVVLHEFTHFLQPNHSKCFYEELSKVCPQWKIFKNKLKQIQLH